MTTSRNDLVVPAPAADETPSAVAETAPAAATPARPPRGHHVPALVLLWILIIVAGYFIWPSKSFLTGEPPQTAPVTQSSP